MRAWFLVLVVGLMGPSALAQEQQDIPQEVIDQLSSDVQALQPSPPPFWSDALAAQFSRPVRAPIVDTPIRAEPNAQSAVLATATEGKILPVIDQEGDWVKVQWQDGSGWIRADKSVALDTRPEMVQASWLGDKVEDLLKQALELYNSYNSNPYVRISGVSLDVSWSPGVNVQFEFVKPASP